MSIHGYCRYCGFPVEQGELECDTCMDFAPPADPEGLHHVVTRWAVEIEGLTRLGGRDIIDAETGGLL